MLQAPQGSDTQSYLQSPLQARGSVISDTNVWKYTLAGAFVWKKTIPSTGGSHVRIRATASKVWVAGRIVHELDSSGNITWAYSGRDYAKGLATDGTNCYVAWAETTPSGTGLLQKFNSSGVSQWTTTGRTHSRTCVLYSGHLYEAGETVGIFKYNASTGAYVSTFTPSYGGYSLSVVQDMVVNGSDLIIFGGVSGGSNYTQSYDLTASPPSLNWTWDAGGPTAIGYARLMHDGTNIWLAGGTNRTNNFTGNSGSYADTWKLTSGGSHSANYDAVRPFGIYFDGTNAWIGDNYGLGRDLVKLSSGLASPTVQDWGTGEVWDITSDGTDLLLTGNDGAV